MCVCAVCNCVCSRVLVHIGLYAVATRVVPTSTWMRITPFFYLVGLTGGMNGINTMKEDKKSAQLPKKKRRHTYFFSELHMDEATSRHRIVPETVPLSCFDCVLNFVRWCGLICLHAYGGELGHRWARVVGNRSAPIWRPRCLLTWPCIHNHRVLYIRTEAAWTFFFVRSLSWLLISSSFTVFFLPHNMCIWWLFRARTNGQRRARRILLQFRMNTMICWFELNVADR